MNNILKTLIAGLCITGLITCLMMVSAYASLPLQADATEVAKKYVNNDKIVLNCQNPTSDVCSVIAKIRNSRKSTKIDFSAYGVTPTLGEIRLFSNNIDANDFSFTTSVKCEDKDFALLPKDALDAECSIEIHLVDGHINGEPRISINQITSVVVRRSAR